MPHLNEARVIDPSGTTAILLLRGLLLAYAGERALSLSEILYEPARAEGVLAEARALHELVARPACTTAAVRFGDALRAAAVHYGYDLGRLADHLVDDRALGDLRLAAARSCRRLAVHQFAQGAPDPGPLQYNREVLEFSSINSFVAGAHGRLEHGVELRCCGRIGFIC